MDTPEEIVESVGYRCVLIEQRSDLVLTVAESDQDRLPRIQIPARRRPAEELQKAIKSRWGLEVFALEIWNAGPGDEACVIAELLTPDRAAALKKLPFERLKGSDLSEEECRLLELLLAGETKTCVSCPGWIDEALAWAGSATGSTFSSKSGIAQWNAGGGFVLLCARSDAGQKYWIKAAGERNAHEFAITQLLAKSYPEFLPKLIAIQAQWNAWLTEDAGTPISEVPDADELVPAARSMARLQLLTVGRVAPLLETGAFDQRLAVLRSHIDRIIEYLMRAMARQASTNPAPIAADRLLEVGEILRDACFRLEALGLPETLIHNDVNPGNILCDGANLVFTDWAETAVGNPFTVCERMCRLNPSHRKSLQAVYRDCWSDRLSDKDFEEAFNLTHLVAVYAYLYGRGTWLKQTEGAPPKLDSYRRGLARHMDRAAREIALGESLCH
jgi:hypothetical protein